MSINNIGITPDLAVPMSQTRVTPQKQGDGSSDAMPVDLSSIADKDGNETIDPKKVAAMKAAQAGGAQAEQVQSQQKIVAVEEPFEKSKTYVPSAKSKLINTETTVSNMKRLALGIKLQENLLMEGPTGAGKTALVKYLAHLTNHELRRINLSDTTDITEIIGGFKPEKDPATGKQTYEWKDGIVVEAMRKGQWLLLDEMNLANPDILERMNSLFDDDRYLVLSEKPDNEIVRPDKDFMIFCTQNPASYSGRKELSDAMKNRLHRMWVDALPAAENVEIMKAISKTKLPDEMLLKMAMFNQTIADMAEHRQLGKRDGPYPFTLRDIIKWLGRIEEQKGDYKDINQVIFQEAQRVYVDRFQTKEDRDLVMDTLTMTFGKAAIPPTRQKDITQLDADRVQIGNTIIERNPLGGPFVPGDDSKLTMTSTGMDQMEKIANCVNNDEQVLLVGPTASGKTSYIRYLGNLANTNVRRYNLSQQTDTTDFIGGFVPTGKPGEFKWRDGILLDAIKPSSIRDTQLLSKAGEGDSIRQLAPGTKMNYFMNKEVNGEKWSFVECEDGQKGWVKDKDIKADWIIFDEINLAEPSILERINSLLDDDRSLVLTEKGNERVQAHPSAKVFATMNPATGRYAGRKELSLAMRNRFTEIWHDEVKNPDDIATIVSFFMRKVPQGKDLAAKMVSFQTEMKDKIMKKEIGAKQRGGYVYTLRNEKYWSNFCKNMYDEKLESLIQDKIQTSLTSQGMDKTQAQSAARKKLSEVKSRIDRSGTLYDQADKAADLLGQYQIDVNAIRAETLRQTFIDGAMHCYADEMADPKDRQAVQDLAVKHFDGTGRKAAEIYSEWAKAGLV
ncbi:MAG: AAA family ATPase [Candidatus Xenobiia bacterium LiM19]